MRQIIERADRRMGGGILTEAKPSKASSLERLVDKMKRLPSRAPTTRELARLVWQKEKGESPWPAMKRSSIAIAEPSCLIDDLDRALQCRLALEPALQELVGAANSGWTEDEIAHALLELAGARLKGRPREWGGI